MAAQAERFATQLQQCVQDAEAAAREVQAALGDGGPSRAERLLTKAERSAGFAKQALGRLETCVRNLPQSEQASLQETCEAGRESVRSVQQRLAEAKGEVQRASLFGGASRGGAQAAAAAKVASSSTSGATDDYAMLEETLATVRRSGASLQDSRATLHQTEDIGVTVLTDLNDQRETLLRTTHKVNETNSTAYEAQRALSRMARRALYNKAVLWAIIVVLLVIIALIVYIKFAR